MKTDHLTKKLLITGVLVILLLLSSSVTGAGTTGGSNASKGDAVNLTVNSSEGSAGVSTTVIALVTTPPVPGTRLLRRHRLLCRR